MKKFSSYIHIVIFIIGVIAGFYVSGWEMFIQPIIEACRHFDAGTLTGTIVGATILKCMFASAVGASIIWLSALVASMVATIIDAINNK